MQGRHSSDRSEAQGGGGGEGTRTHDRLVANQVLYQLSYTPLSLVGLAGFEPATSRLSGGRSNQLSYRPNLVETGAGLSGQHLL